MGVFSKKIVAYFNLNAKKAALSQRQLFLLVLWRGDYCKIVIVPKSVTLPLVTETDSFIAPRYPVLGSKVIL